MTDKYLERYRKGRKLIRGKNSRVASEEYNKRGTVMMIPKPQNYTTCKRAHTAHNT